MYASDEDDGDARPREARERRRAATARIEGMRARAGRTLAAASTYCTGRTRFYLVNMYCYGHPQKDAQWHRALRKPVSLHTNGYTYREGLCLYETKNFFRGKQQPT